MKNLIILGISFPIIIFTLFLLGVFIGYLWFKGRINKLIKRNKKE